MGKIARFKWPIVLALMGLVLQVVGAVALVGSFQDSGTSFLAPGNTRVTITRPGEYTLWHESQTLIDGQVMTFPDNLPDGVTIKVLKKPEGTVVPLRHGWGTRMESGSTRRVSVGALVFDTPGEYEIAVTGLDGKRAFYLGQDHFLAGVLTMMICGSAGMLLLFVAVGWGVYVLVRLCQGKA